MYEREHVRGCEGVRPMYRLNTPVLSYSFVRHNEGRIRSDEATVASP